MIGATGTAKDPQAAAHGADLDVRLETPIPPSLPVGRATALFVYGTCFHRHRRVESLQLIVDGVGFPVAAARMPRVDLFRALHPESSAARQAGSQSGDRRSAEDPDGRSYRSGFWATVAIEARDRPGVIEIRAEAALAGGGSSCARLGGIAVVEPSEPPVYPQLAGRSGAGLVAIAMTTFDPELELFRAQIASLREQTDPDWICLISDDCSPPDRFAAIEATVAGDPRFVLSRAESRLGFYRNFERALEMVPPEADVVALCDQDDRWYSDKLQTLRCSIGEAQLVYSDQRLVDADGRVLAETLWTGRRNNFTNFSSLLIANTITGAATLFRREVLDFALPFPDPPGWQFHDHWLGMVAMATGDLAYVDRPLYDYVQHPGAILGQVATEDEGAEERVEAARWVRPLTSWRGWFSRWRAAYFCAYLRLEVQAQVLLARCSTRLTPGKRRALRRFVAAQRSPLAFAWLVARLMRGPLGRDETLGAEGQLVAGIAWRPLVVLRARRRERPGRSSFDASRPPCGPDSFGQRRLRRWRARS